MKYIPTEIPDVWILEPTCFQDARGYFMETYSQKEFEEAAYVDGANPLVAFIKVIIPSKNTKPTFEA